MVARPFFPVHAFAQRDLPGKERSLEHVFSRFTQGSKDESLLWFYEVALEGDVDRQEKRKAGLALRRTSWQIRNYRPGMTTQGWNF